MAERVYLYPDHPQKREIARVVERIKAGAVIAYPTDSSYALGCHLGDRDAVERIRRLRGFDRRHFFTLLCRDLSELSTYAKVDNVQYRLLKQATPGPFTFVLSATKDVPRRLQQEKRKTIGIRVPGTPITNALLNALGEPLMTCSLIPQSADLPLSNADDVEDQYDKLLDIIVDGGPCGLDPTTVIDLTSDPFEVLRRGKGALEDIGLE